VHVYGAASDTLGRSCTEHNIPLNVFEWRNEYAAAGLARNASYLLRPDTYVAMADASATPEAIERYWNERGIVVGG
jgi:hypothetical protein